MRTAHKVVLDRALQYAKIGLPVFPVHRPIDGGCSCKKKTCQQIGKHPATAQGFKDSTLDEKQIRRWFGTDGTHRGYNVGVLCGEGWVCLDVDPKNDGDEAFEQLIQDHKALPETWVEETGEDKDGNRGRHYWFRIPDNMRGVRLKTRKPLPNYNGVDFLATNQYAIVAPSAHVSGVNYDTVTPIEDVADCPDWLLDLSEEVTEDEVYLRSSPASPTGIRPGPEVRAFLREGNIPPGGQRDMIVKAARALWGLWVEADEASDLIWDAIKKCEWDEDRGDWTHNQVARIVQDEYSSEPKALDSQAGVSLPTDVGRALRLTTFARGNIKFVGAMQEWFHWDETVWRMDKTDIVGRMLHSMTFRELQEAAMHEDPDVASPIRKEAMKLQSSSTIRNTLTETKRRPEIALSDDEFDRDKYLLNCRNVTIDLRTGRTRPQRREDYITRVTRFSYYEDARSDLWERVVSDACGGDQDMIDYLQMALGYACMGVTTEDAFFYLYGPGGTGKTTVVETAAHVLGAYATAADPETFMLAPTSAGETRADLAILRGKRLVISSEISAGSKFSASTINRLTGKDTIAARVPYAKAPLVFKPEWTLFFAANHFPSVPGATKRDGFWRRVKVIPFEHAIRREEMNLGLPHLLALPEHGEGILSWLVTGARKWWQEYGANAKNMPVPKGVESANTSVQSDADPFNEFVATLIFEDGSWTTKADMHQYYLAWAADQGMTDRQTLSSNRFSRKLREVTGIENKQKWDGTSAPYQWENVRLPLSKG